jgi:hypothetical protein
MQKILALCLLSLMIFLPAAPALAQGEDDGGGTFYDCDPFNALDNLTISLTFITDLAGVEDFLLYALGYLLECGDDWALQLIGSLFGLDMGMGGGDAGDYGGDYGDYGYGASSLTPEDAEFALNSAFSGDFITANFFFCPEDQFTAEDQAELANVTLNSLDCTASPEGETITCTFDLSLTEDGETSQLVDKVIFETEDGLLCSQD